MVGKEEGFRVVSGAAWRVIVWLRAARGEEGWWVVEIVL